MTMTDPVAVRLPERAVLWLDGPDAAELLQGLVSNDVRLLTPERALYAALLTPQGKYLHDFVLYRQGDAILLDTERERADELRRRLLMYRLRAKVGIELPDPQPSVLAVLGEAAAGRLGLVEEPGAARAEGEAVLAVDPRLAALGGRAVLPTGAVEGFLAAHRLATAPAEAYDRHRLALGVPEGSADLVPQKGILLEANFEELHGVSFDKGCFVGQELTARTKHRALIRKRLLPVAVEGPLPEPGTIVTAGEKEVGEMRSGRDGRALALLRLEPALAAVRDGTALRAGDARLRPEVPPWVRLDQA